MEKKHLTVVIILLVIAFGFYAYCYPPYSPEETTSLNSLTAKTGVEASSESKSTHLVSKRIIREMIENYREIQLKAIENGKNPVHNDANSILFDVDTLKMFIQNMENATNERKPGVKHKFGIRMYYAAYPLKEKWNAPGYQYLKKMLGNKITELYERKHTLIMIPALQNEKGIYVDFNPFDLKSYQGFKRRVTNRQYLLQDGEEDEEVPAFNHGQLIPPASDEGQGF